MSAPDLARKNETTSLRDLPKHVAIIMDGNGRWAKSHKFARIQGHLEGIKRVEEITEAARKMGIEVLTLFTFSTENWSRSPHEISMLMDALCSALEKRLEKMTQGNVRLSLIGRREDMPLKVLQSLDKAIDTTKDNTGLILNLAFNYGARMEILDAAKHLAVAVQEGRLDINEIDETAFSQALYTKGLPDPDLLIRTSGEKRVSNFLLWQLSYAEFYFTDTFWPDFDKDEFGKAIRDYKKRDRRFGRIN